MKSASQMSMEIRAKKKAMQSQETKAMNPDDIQLESEELAADSPHGELMADAHDRAHETEEPNPREIMMAEGGEVQDEKESHKDERVVMHRPDKGFGAVTVIEDAKPIDEASKRRMERLKKMMGK